MKRKIVIFYHDSDGNRDIRESDYKHFYRPLNLMVKPIPMLKLEPVSCPAREWLFDKLRDLTGPDEEADELYLHFSGHGQSEGIPYGDWVVSNQDFADMVRHPKVKSCYFSSCQSGDLVRLVNENSIPVVIGTAGPNDIENRYAIDFQLAFYEGLIHCRSFDSAFSQARVLTKSKHGKEVPANVFVRGEGALDDIAEVHVNALQIVFHAPKYAEAHLIPPTFLDELRNISDGKPAILAYSDDPVRAAEFEGAFKESGWQQYMHLVHIPEGEVGKINDRGDMDPFQLQNIFLLLLLSHQHLLPEELRTHLANHENWGQEQYRIFCAHKDGIDLASAFDSHSIRQKFDSGHIFSFHDNPGELLDNQEFERLLHEQEIELSLRKKITLGFEVRPNREEMAVVYDMHKIACVFFAKNENEKLVNFLVNWIREKDELKFPVVVIDNQYDADLEFMSSLKKEIVPLTKKEQNLNLQFIDLLRPGCIMIFRYWEEELEPWQDFISEVLDAVSITSSIITEKEKPQSSAIFFLSNFSPDELQLPGNVKVERFSKPTPVNDEILETWRSEFSPLKFNPKVSQMVQAVSAEIDPNRFSDCCPSAVIEFVCEKFRIPAKQIVGL